MIEFFAVPAGEDEAFLAAWRAEAPEATLLRALRDDVRWRYASVDAGVLEQGVLLLVPAAPDGWEAPFAGRQGFLGARLDGDVGVAHWSSPLMYARAAPHALPSGAALYVKVQP